MVLEDLKMPAMTWNGGGAAGHDTGDASPYLQVQMPIGKQKTKPD